ncbi:MAG: GHKL domain-containing protein [Lachnospiraceae bacterium]|nr:GHKL domain-containing protein [Lachnospiraceae bacterium]
MSDRLQQEAMVTEERQQESTEKEESIPRRSRNRKYRLTGSLPAKIIAFFLLAGSCLAGLLFTGFCIYIGINGYYTEGRNAAITDAMRKECMDTLYDFASLVDWGDIEEARKLCENKNIDIQLIWIDERGRDNVLLDTREGRDGTVIMDLHQPFRGESGEVSVNRHTMKEDQQYLYRAFIDMDFPCDDNFRRSAEEAVRLYELRYGAAGLAVGSILFCIICFIFLLCSAGHRSGQNDIVPGVLTGIPLDVLTVIFFCGAMFFTYILFNFISFMDDLSQVVTLAVGGTILLVCMTFYFMDFALRVKRGRCWRSSLIFKILRGIWRGGGFLIGRIPLVITTVMVYFGICILELVGVTLFVRAEAGVLLWALEKVILLFLILYIAVTCKKLLNASRALAEGRGDYEVNTAGMFGEFKEHGENLNGLGQGIARAVAEKIKSEHLKTELISNVSHDLKTPLTSIINYTDLIYEETARAGKQVSDENSDAACAAMDNCRPEEVDRAKIAEYAEVLLRQSRRLKKLMEDLMEAAKATTGNLEVNPESCEVGVLLSQAVGEYQQRMEEKELELITRQPEEPVKIMADGRHLWRVFDNLLNNICKYAQEKSRVYLSVEEKEGRVWIIFRNMSKYALNLPADELEERFVRGDKSRHMEGNGLGLSIAKSLVELQKGQMEILVDGDLFKVTVSFPCDS